MTIRKKGIIRTTFLVISVLALLNGMGCRQMKKSGLDALLEQFDAVAIMFLTPDCPLAKNYTRPFLDLNEDYADSSIAFIGVLPGKLYSREEIETYTSTYNFTVPVIEDTDFHLTSRFSPEVTPEFVLVSKSGVIYQGALDNWMKGLGQYRKRPTKFYLRDAIAQWKNNSPITNAKTQAYGCFIEYP